MSDKQQEQIKSVFCEVLESLAFMFGDPVEMNHVPAHVDACLEASIAFTGPRRGTLVLAAPAGVADELAANILGIEPDEDATDEHAHDALGELMNITLGKLLTELDGETPVYDLTPPTVRQAGDEIWTQLHDAPGTVAFVIDDNPIMLRFIPTAA